MQGGRFVNRPYGGDGDLLRHGAPGGGVLRFAQDDNIGVCLHIEPALQGMRTRFRVCMYFYVTRNL